MPQKNKEEKIYIPKSTAELLPFVCIDKGLFYMNDKSYVDIMQIVTKDLISASESEIEFDMLQFEKFYKMYAADCKIIGINFPTDTKRQQQYYQHKLNTTDNPLFKEILQTNYEELVDVNLYYTDREYYLMVFCASYEKYLEAKNIITVTLKNVGLFPKSVPQRKSKSSPSFAIRQQVCMGEQKGLPEQSKLIITNVPQDNDSEDKP